MTIVRFTRWLALRSAVIAAAALVVNVVSVGPTAGQERGERREWGDRGDRPDWGGRGEGGRRDGGRGDGRGDGRRGEGGRGPGGDRRPDRPGRAPDPRPAPTSTPAAASSTPSATSFGTTSEADKIRKMATDKIKANDKDGNGILEGDELAQLGMSRGADKDGDAKITHNELVAFYTPKSAPPAAAAANSSPAASATPAAASSAAAAERKIVNKSRKSYRFKSTKERTNSWRLSSRDANGDGQVSMSEYSRTWNDRTASEFERYDKDGDGMITAAEAP